MVDQGAPAIEMESLWRAKEAMNYLRVSKRELIRLVHEQGLPCCKFAGKTSPLRFRPESVRAWVIEREFQVAS